MKLLTLFICSSLAMCPVFAQESQPTNPPQFQWNLHLTKGETWTQTTIINSRSVQHFPAPQGRKPASFEIDIKQTTGFKNEVVDVAPTYYLVRVTYTQSKTDTSFKVDGKSPPVPSKPKDPTSDFIGVSFLLKQAPDGRVLDVTGLEQFLARQKKMMDDLSKNSAVGALFENMGLSADSFKKTIARTQALALSRKPLSVGESYFYATNVPVLGQLDLSIKGKRTLLSFNDQNALFDEGGTFSIPPTLMFKATNKKSPSSSDTTKTKVVVLMGDAAKLYMARKYRAKPDPQPTYLSKNGRIYYREANNPAHVIWLDPPGNIAIPESEAAPYRDLKGFNGKTEGKSLSDFYSGNGGMNTMLDTSAVPAIQLPQMFVVMNGTITGKSTVDVATGLTLKSDLTQTITGKMTVITPDGHKQSVPLSAISTSTSSIQKD